MDNDTMVRVEKARKLILRCSELVNTIDQNSSEIEAISTKIDIANAVEKKNHDDMRFINMAPERIEHNKEIIDKASKQLFEILGV